MNHPVATALTGGKILSLSEAADTLRQGRVVAYPTETFFGVGCKACHAEAVQRVYGAKQRPYRLPLPVLGGDMAQLRSIAVFDEQAEALGAHFWPGPLTLLLPALPPVPELITAGTGRVALRLSSHPTARALALAAGEPLVCSSANMSGKPAAKDYRNIDPLLVASLDGIVVEGPQPGGGLPSTLIELLGDGWVRIFRQGAVSRAALEEAGCKVMTSG